MRLLLPCIAALIATFAARGAEPETFTVEVPKGDKVTIKIPAGWQKEVIQEPGVPPTVKLTAPSNEASVQITFIPDVEGHFGSKEAIEKVVAEMGEQFVSDSVEKSVTLKPITSKNGEGSYATFTDAKLADTKTLPQGEYRCVTSGVLAIKKQAAAFTMLSNDPAGAEHRQALAIIAEGITVE